MSAPKPKLPSAGSELITVQIGDQQFAIDIMSVREIRGWTATTPLPHAPAYVHGMIDLRGTVLPVVDLGSRLGLSSTQPDRSSVVVVAQINDRPVGLLVDAVCDIVLVTENMLQQTPDVGTAVVQDFVQGVMTTEDGIVTMLCLDQVLPSGLDASMARTPVSSAPAARATSPLTAAEIKLVRSSFEQVVPIAEAAAGMFYERLFEQNPELRSMFTGDMAEQGRKLMQMLTTAVKALDKVKTLAPALEALAVRHQGYGVRPQHYDAVGAALLWTLGQGLGEAFTPEVEAAWTKTYGLIADVMLGATQAKAA